MGWPWTNKGELDKDTQKIILEDNKRLRETIEDLESILEKQRFEISQLKLDVAIYDGAKELECVVKHWLHEYSRKRCAERSDQDKVIEKLTKENRQLKSSLKAYQNRLKTFTAGLPEKSNFDTIDTLKDRIDKFLIEEDPMFIQYVKDVLDKADYYEEFATKNSITLNKDSTTISKWLQEDIPQWVFNDVGLLRFLDKIAKELYSRAMYKPFVRRSIAMNNKTKDMLQDIRDTLDLLNNGFTDELIQLKIENKKLKENILIGDQSEQIQQLEREINNLKIENEALRYKQHKEV